MKLALGISCLALLLGVYNCNPHSLAADTRKPVDLSHVCVHMISSHGNTDDKSPIVLLHGLFFYKESWYPLMQLLAFNTGRKVCAADLRNHNDSPWSDEFDTIVMAEDVKRLVEKLDTDKIILLGHSLGGKTAVQFSLSYPEKVEKLIIEDMRPNGFRQHPIIKKMVNFDKAALEGILSVIPEGATEKEARRAVYNVFSNMFTQMNITIDLDDVVVNYFPIKCSNGKCSWKSNIDAISKSDIYNNVTTPHSSGKYDGPTLFIYGGKSPLRVGDVKDEIYQLFPKAELYEIKNASHIVNTFPEYKQKVLNFILE